MIHTTANAAATAPAIHNSRLADWLRNSNRPVIQEGGRCGGSEDGLSGRFLESVQRSDLIFFSPPRLGSARNWATAA